MKGKQIETSSSSSSSSKDEEEDEDDNNDDDDESSDNDQSSSSTPDLDEESIKLINKVEKMIQRLCQGCAHPNPRSHFYQSKK